MWYLNLWWKTNSICVFEWFDLSSSKSCWQVASIQSNNKKDIYKIYTKATTTLMAESEEGLKSLLMRVKEKSEKAGLTLNIQKMKIMASSPITSWQTEGEKLEAVTDFIFLVFKINQYGGCSHKTKRRLLLGRKAVINLCSILESRDITLPTIVHIVKAMVFPVVTCGCESWTVKKSKHQRIDAFKLWYLRRFLRVSWAARYQTSQS